ncbi:5-bromo-4-chloroindolyl phosphate hydrolase [Exiguobacterium sp. U13-1]|uniref:5-bromo-4-chloroindolyl phosphate hydrolysis family protein n=1 Tax=Exiguobacterium acetylicum TaxID=41170 RepID=A0ABX8G5S1_EXIAC|nr:MULTISPECIES: 5-bromo-4-chloroindolyl phosphate hydrolysis family protein [Exiguobacterium]AOT00960.1 5-bromo-4-chloroindolyl phosphate hydrolase [Exiguobacterium sp. U13-1]QWB28913.1 5-bromo-4-chloroindolyl phosphate hydrolysis family protein [Exiguobacterium acetylicum]
MKSSWWIFGSIGMMFVFLQLADTFSFSGIFIALGLWFIWSGYRTKPGRRYRTERKSTEIKRKNVKKKLLLDDEEEFVGSVILKPERATRRFEETDDLELQVLQRTIEEGFAKIQTYDQIVPSIRDSEIRSEMRIVSREAHVLFEELYESPRDVKKVRDFFTFYLDSLLSISEKYADLERRGAQVQLDTKNQLISNLKMIGQKLKQQQTLLLEGDTVDLERELLTIEKVLAQETEQRKQEESYRHDPF